MRRYMLDITINDRENGEFIEQFGMIFIDIKEHYDDTDEIVRDVLNGTDNWERMIYDCRTTKPHDEEIYFAEVIELENAPEEDYDEDEEGREDND